MLRSSAGRDRRGLVGGVVCGCGCGCGCGRRSEVVEMRESDVIGVSSTVVDDIGSCDFVVCAGIDGYVAIGN